MTFASALSAFARLSSLSFGRKVAASFGFGLLAALAFPPFHLVPVLWLSFPALVLLLRGAGRKRQAFAIGWAFALGLLSVSFHWIAGALFVDIKSFWWAVPLAVFGLPAVLGIYYGFAAMAARRWGLRRIADLFFFALSWFGAEMARAHLFTGFPWDILGYVWADCPPILQSVSVIGIEGLTLLTIMLAVLPAAIFVEGINRKKAMLFLSIGVFVFFFMAAWGQYRLSSASLEIVPDVRLRLVQPGTQQAMKWKAERRMLNFNGLLNLTFDAPAEKPVTHYIWPETATSFYLAEEPMARADIARRMPEGTVLLTGSVRRAIDEESNAYRYYNSLIVMDFKGNIVGGYDKHHLVPFGEYMPWRSVIPFRVVTALGTDFSAGEGIRSVRAAGLPPFSALVCYEAIFSGEVVEKGDPPRFLLNVTNDAWYEGTIGPAQHFAIAKVRAVEEGLPLVRAANKGITGVVDPYGRVTARIGAKEAGYVDAYLPKALSRTTIFAEQGVKRLWFMAACLLFALIILRCKKK